VKVCNGSFASCFLCMVICKLRLCCKGVTFFGSCSADVKLSFMTLHDVLQVVHVLMFYVIYVLYIRDLN
jgi:hypothetical protein